jgi:hypothetical protein
MSRQEMCRAEVETKLDFGSVVGQEHHANPRTSPIRGSGDNLDSVTNL